MTSKYFKSVSKFVLVALASFVIYSCGGSRASGSGGPISKYIEEFFVGEGVIQYFIKPIDYEGLNQTKKTALDATIRNTNKLTDSVTVNFTVNLKERQKIKTVMLSTGNKPSIQIDSVSTFYVESEEDYYLHRASIKIPYATYYGYLLDDTHMLKIDNSASSSLVIKPKSKSKKTISVLRSKLDRKMN